MTFSTKAVSELVGATLRELDWWDHQGVVSPSRFGSKLRYSQKRTYTVEEVERLAVIVQLRRNGMSLQSIRRILPEIERRGRLNGKRYLLTDGRDRVFIEKEDSAIVNHLAKSHSAMQLLSLDNILQPIRQLIHKHSSPKHLTTLG